MNKVIGPCLAWYKEQYPLHNRPKPSNCKASELKEQTYPVMNIADIKEIKLEGVNAVRAMAMETDSVYLKVVKNQAGESVATILSQKDIDCIASLSPSVSKNDPLPACTNDGIYRIEKINEENELKLTKVDLSNLSKYMQDMGRFVATIYGSVAAGSVMALMLAGIRIEGKAMAVTTVPPLTGVVTLTGIAAAHWVSAIVGVGVWVGFVTSGSGITAFKYIEETVSKTFGENFLGILGEKAFGILGDISAVAITASLGAVVCKTGYNGGRSLLDFMDKMDIDNPEEIVGSFQNTCMSHVTNAE